MEIRPYYIIIAVILMEEKGWVLLQQLGHLEYYLKNIIVFAVKCQKVLANCAKAVYNNNAIL